MQQRYYDPGIGMFLSVDPVTAYSNPVGQFQRYRYANNNPYRFTDPDGRCPKGLDSSKCISNSNVPANAKSVEPSSTTMATATTKGGRLPDPEPGKESMGVIVEGGDGKQKLSIDRQSSTTSNRTANIGTTTAKEGTVAVIHQHSPGGDLRDDLNPKLMGDAGPILENGIPNIAQTDTLRRAVHGVWDGQYQIRTVGGTTFSADEQSHFQQRVDYRQEVLNESNN